MLACTLPLMVSLPCLGLTSLTSVRSISSLSASEWNLSHYSSATLNMAVREYSACLRPYFCGTDWEGQAVAQDVIPQGYLGGGHQGCSGDESRPCPEPLGPKSCTRAINTIILSSWCSAVPLPRRDPSLPVALARISMTNRYSIATSGLQSVYYDMFRSSTKADSLLFTVSTSTMPWVYRSCLRRQTSVVVYS